MKRIIIICLLCTAILCACQPTPEEDAVRQKDSVKMIEMAIGDATEAPNDAEAQTAATPVPVREQVPERLVWDLYTDVENVHVVADVPIRIMTEDTVPLLRVEPRRFKASDNLAIVQALLGTDTVYKSVYQLTRQDLEKQISDLMNTLSDPYNNEELLEDYELTSLSLYPRPRTEPYFQTWLKKIASFSAAGKPFSEQVEQYLLKIGLSQEELNRIREILLERK